MGIMTDTTAQPPGHWHGVVARLGVPDGDGQSLLEPPPPGQGVTTATPYPLPLHALLPDRPAIGMAPGGPTLREVGTVDDLAADGDKLWGRGRFHLDTEDGRDAARSLERGESTLAAVSIRVDEQAYRTVDGRQVTVYTRFAVLAAMITDSSRFPDTVVTALREPPASTVPAPADAR